VLDGVLQIAEDARIADLDLGDEVAVSGFAGEGSDLLAVTPGESAPSASAQTGNVSGLRSFGNGAAVTTQGVDLIQHQIRTTAGSSGAPLIACGEVVAVHNAGTEQIVLEFDNVGNVTVVRKPADSANFGIHAGFLREMLEPRTPNNHPRSTFPPPDPSFNGKYVCTASAGTSLAQAHTLAFDVRRQRVTGTSDRANGNYVLDGTINEFGEIFFSDDGSQQGNLTTAYSGFANAQSGRISGQYFLGLDSASWSCERQ